MFLGGRTSYHYGVQRTVKAWAPCSKSTENFHIAAEGLKRGARLSIAWLTRRRSALLPGPPPSGASPLPRPWVWGKREEGPCLDMALGSMGRGALHSRENGLNSWARWLLLSQISWRNLVSSHGKQPRGATTFSTRFFPTGTLSLSVKIFTSLSSSLNCFSTTSNNERISCAWRGSVILHKSL